MSGLLVILSSPSGGGKTSVIQSILKRYPDDFFYSISATTRQKRNGEIDGKDYFFYSEDQFKIEINEDKFLEWEIVHGYYYGTPKHYINNLISSGKVVFLDLDVNGALRVAKKYPEKIVTIFIAPPSIDELIKRLKNRKTESEDEINKRLERIPLEMEKSKLFNYILINEYLDKTVEQVLEIIKKE